ncbi:MAG: preprotein translocase subunit YajC [Simkaniaceae bacterium]|nr:preprotein translocase subunit YajC [Simkaniaceae bacterium]
MKNFLALLGVFSLSSVSLFAEDGAPAQGNNFMQTIFMIGIAVIFFYFILWRPEQKRRKKMTQQRETLKTGDKVTAMGIIGTVEKIQDETVILTMYDGSKIEVIKGAITDVKKEAAPEVQAS